MDPSGNVASTVSSGGIALKQPGRAQAGLVLSGAGVGRRGPRQTRRYTVGISTTGCGEHLVRTFLARECALELNKSAVPINGLQKVMKEKFAESEFLSVPEKLGGAICMHYDESSGQASSCGRTPPAWASPSRRQPTPRPPPKCRLSTESGQGGSGGGPG